MPALEQNDKKLSVLKAATSVFLAHGFSAATTDMIQREAGVSKATMYACFPNKEAMFVAVIERRCAIMAETLKDIPIAPGDIAGTLTEIGTSYLKFLLSPDIIAMYRVVVAEAPRFPDLGPRFYRAGPRVVASMVAERLSEAARSGQVDLQSFGVEAVAALFIGMVRAEGHLEYLMHPDARPSAAQMDQWARLAVTTFLRAFGVTAAR
ncbi:MAG: TetR/AcrR family transcriptional regulator [Candidatus Accumulibacter sp.]|jgi:AcrR family transcriptional regulator|nr:TetR/AcrR family transcriptional regulator [Accumulibacter sp.]